MTIRKNRWINTFTVWQWDGEKYVEVHNEGYQHDGPVALAGSADTYMDAYRFYESDNSTAAGNQDTTTTLDVDTTYIVRVRIFNNGNKDESAQTFDLTYDYNSGTASGAVTGASSYVQTADATGLTNGTAVTAGTLTGASGDFINGEECEDGVPASQTIVQQDYTENWYAFTIVGTDVSNNDTITLGVSAPDTAVSTPTITVRKLTTQTVTLQSESNTLTDGTLNILQQDLISLTADSMTLTDGTLTILQAQNISLTSDDMTLTDGTLDIARSFTVTPISDDMTLSDQQLTITQGTYLNLISDDMTLTDGTLSITRGSYINLTSDDMTISEQQLTVTQDQTQTITLTSDDMTLTDGTMSITRGAYINLTSDDMTLTDGTMGISAASRLYLTSDDMTLGDGTLTIFQKDTVALTSDDMTLTDGSLSIFQKTTISLTPDSMTLSDGTLTVLQSQPVSLTSDDMTITEGQLSIPTGGNTITLIADSKTVTDGTLTVTRNYTNLARLNLYVNEIWQLYGLDHTSPVNITKGTVSADNWTITYTGNDNQKVLTRTGTVSYPDNTLAELVEKIQQVWKFCGLDPDDPFTNGRTLQSTSDIEVTLTGNGETSTIMTRSDQVDYLNINGSGDDLLINTTDKLKINNYG